MPNPLPWANDGILQNQHQTLTPQPSLPFPTCVSEVFYPAPKFACDAWTHCLWRNLIRRSFCTDSSCTEINAKMPTPNNLCSFNVPWGIVCWVMIGNKGNIKSFPDFSRYINCKQSREGDYIHAICLPPWWGRSWDYLSKGTSFKSWQVFRNKILD